MREDISTAVMNCERVIAELKKWHGEKIVADEHPLHFAVQQLEQSLICRRDPEDQEYWNLKGQKGTLPVPASTYWYSLLAKSRKVVRKDSSTERLNRLTRFQVCDVLIDLIQSIRSTLLLLQRGNTLPKVRSTRTVASPKAKAEGCICSRSVSEDGRRFDYAIAPLCPLHGNVSEVDG